MLLNLLGGVALLLWGMRTVEDGVGKAFGADLRRLVGRSVRTPVLGALVGLGVTGLLQSSTATALITASFARQGLMATAQALAVMLGADVGSALVVQVLSFDLRWLAPLLLVGGVLGHRLSRITARRNVARAGIGLGLILLALGQIVQVAAPLRGAVVLEEVLGVLAGEPVLLLLLGALVTWLAHSSLMVVLLVASLAGAGVCTLPTAFALVLGANLGAIAPQITATLGAPPDVRRIPLGNGLFKVLGVAAVMPLLGYVPEWLGVLGAGPAREVAHFHLAFNLALAAVFLALTGPAARLLALWLPDAPQVEDPLQPRYLERSAIETPSLALAHSERETLRMGDIVQGMLERTLDVLRHNDEPLLREVVRRDDAVDALHQAIKFYLLDVSREPLSDAESHRAQEIVSFTINLEQIGDIIESNMMDLAAKKIRHRLNFSPEGFQEVCALHARLVENLKLAFAVFMSGDTEMARRLLREKTSFRQMERAAAESHLARLRGKRIESIDTSAIHIDLLTEMRRINSHLTSVAYPILERAGELFSSRLKPSA